MGRFLFTTWEGGGHVQPLLLAAQGLAARGHQVLAISDACNAADAAALAVPFQPWRTAPSRPDKSPEGDPLKDWLATNPMAVIAGLANGLMCGPAGAYAADTAAAIDAFAPDVVVTQELLLGAMAAAEARRAPLAIFAANVWSLPTLPGAPPFGVGLPPARDDAERAMYAQVTAATRGAFQIGLPGLNAARAGLGLAPLADIFDQLDVARRILLATSRAFDFDGSPPAPFAYVGPYLSDPTWAAAWSSPWPDGADEPLVLVAFSSMYQAQEETTRRVIEALGALPVRGLVTLGPVLALEDFPAPDNVRVVASAPHGALYPRASVVITHAGHGTTLRPLMAGAPLLCLPMGRDQPDNAVRVTERGAGLRLAKDAGADDIAAAVRRLLDEPAFAAAARDLGHRIAADMTARSAEDALEALLVSSR
jgi:MGT family glycosyltransferase